MIPFVTPANLDDWIMPSKDRFAVLIAVLYFVVGLLAIVAASMAQEVEREVYKWVAMAALSVCITYELLLLRRLVIRFRALWTRRSVGGPA